MILPHIRFENSCWRMDLDASDAKSVHYSCSRMDLDAFQANSVQILVLAYGPWCFSGKIDSTTPAGVWALMLFMQIRFEYSCSRMDLDAFQAKSVQLLLLAYGP